MEKLERSHAPLEGIRTILIIERNPALLEWLMNTVSYSKKAFRGVGFSSNNDALHWIEQARSSDQLPSVVLLDCSIPTEETYTVLRTLSACQMHNGPDIVVLAITTQSTPPPGREWELIPLLQKPFRPRELFQTIISLLRIRKIAL